MNTWRVFVLSFTLAAVPAVIPGDDAKPAVTIGALAVEPAVVVREIPPDQTHSSKLLRLSWSDDDADIYLNSYTLDDHNRASYFHFVVRTDGGELKEVPSSTAWAEKYWAWKHPLREQHGKAELTEKRLTITAASGRSLEGFQGNIPETDVYLAGKRLRDFVGEQYLLGHWYGWGPPGTDILVYTNKKGEMSAIGYDGAEAKVLLKGKYILPAWSNRADRIAFVETKKDGKLWRLLVAKVR